MQNSYALNLQGFKIFEFPAGTTEYRHFEIHFLWRGILTGNFPLKGIYRTPSSSLFYWLSWKLFSIPVSLLVYCKRNSLCWCDLQNWRLLCLLFTFRYKGISTLSSGINLFQIECWLRWYAYDFVWSEYSLSCIFISIHSEWPRAASTNFHKNYHNVDCKYTILHLVFLVANVVLFNWVYVMNNSFST